MSWVSEVRKMIDRAVSAVRLAFRGEILLVNSSYLANITGLEGETDTGVEMFQQYGFDSRPPVGAEFIAIPLGRKGANAVVLSTRHWDLRLDLEEGEVGLGLKDNGHVKIKANGDVEIQAKDDSKVHLKATDVSGGGHILCEHSTGARMELDASGYATLQCKPGLAPGIYLNDGGGGKALVTADEFNIWVATVHDLHVHTGVTAGGANTGNPLVGGATISGTTVLRAE